jgi:segregation and condensation protein A
MSLILDRVKGADYVIFESLFTPKEGRMGVVVTFMAVLELLKEAMIAVVQNEPFSPIYVKAAA